MFEKVIVAVDGSEEASHALEVACDLANKYGSKVHLVHSPQMETTGIAVGSGAIEFKPSPEKIAEAGKGVIDEATSMAKSMGCSQVKSIVGGEDPATQILKAIDDTGADLVVMGRRGLGRVSSALLGSVSQKVSSEAECTCMTVC